MNPAPAVAVIISTFDQPDYLERVLPAISRQSRPPDEMLLADDGSGEATRRLFARWADQQSFRCEHLWQPHQGFRKTRILNEAIARARCPYLVFLDGDTLMHPDFVRDHGQLAQDRTFAQGHRVLVQRRAADWFGRGVFNRDRRRAFWQGQLSNLKVAYRWPRPLRRIRQDLHGIRGCNQGIWRADLLTVNGYNEDFEGWGREDSELGVRLMHAGIQRLDIRGWALCYHLWHEPLSRGQLPANDERLEQAMKTSVVTCVNGVNHHLPLDEHPAV
jgi:glycosyltransferase involved in cell wall biosynthesis